MTPLQTALARRGRQQELTADLRAEAGRLWASVDRSNIRDSWTSMLSRIVVLLAAIQQIAAGEAEGYVLAALEAQNVDTDSHGQVRPDGFAGFASDGRPLDSLMYQPVPATLTAIEAGASQAQAMATGWAVLDMILSTQVADSFRASASVAMATKPKVTRYVRMLVPPSCSRCAILAGEYSYRTPFKRHPRCDCVGIPATEATSGDLVTDARVDPKDYFNSLSRSEQDRVFTEGGAQAIRDGADIYRVVNARRKAAGLQSAAENQLGLLRQQGTLSDVQALSGNPRITFSRTISQDRRDKRVRVMPETIYRIARDRDHAIELLKANGFITEDYRDRLMRVRGFV